MYSSNLKSRDRSAAIGAAAAVQAALLIAFLNLAGTLDRSETQVPLHLVDVPTISPPRPVVIQQPSKPRAKQGGSSEPNLKSDAAASTPHAQMIAPPANTIATTVKPHNATDGNSSLRGPGVGSGGSGIGNGEGSGSGSGDGGAVEPPHLATAVLSGYDFPPEIIDQWPRSATVFLRLKINARGSVSECMVDRGTNVPAIDLEMCNLAHERLRFWPAMDRNRRAVAGWFGYAQPAPR